MEYKTGYIFIDIFPDKIRKGVIEVSENNQTIVIRFNNSHTVTVTKQEFDKLLITSGIKLFESEQKLTEYILRM